MALERIAATRGDKNLSMIVLKYYNEAEKFRELLKMASLREPKKGGRDGE